MTNTNNNFLYVQVKNYILKLINDNISIPEYKLPTEAEIMKSQNVSRITVRKAFEDLIGLNIVTRIKWHIRKQGRYERHFKTLFYQRVV